MVCYLGTDNYLLKGISYYICGSNAVKIDVLLIVRFIYAIVQITTRQDLIRLCYTIIFSTIFEIKTPTQVGVPDSKIALHVNVHFYTDKVVIM